VIYLLTTAVGFASALIPVVNVEVYLLSLLALHVNPVAAAGAGALGQTAGKVVVFLSARKAVHWKGLTRVRERWRAWWRAKLRRPVRVPSLRSLERQARWAARVERAATYRYGPVAVIAVSAVAGLPPLLLTSALAGATTMRTLTFTLACLSGRFVRFAALLALPGVVQPLL
jgi:membrane protein YqaA with SNARE-associated domain